MQYPKGALTGTIDVRNLQFHPHTLGGNNEQVVIELTDVSVSIVKGEAFVATEEAPYSITLSLSTKQLPEELSHFPDTCLDHNDINYILNILT